MIYFKIVMFWHFVGFACVIDFTAIISHAIPITLDIVRPINKTRGENVHITSEYFVDHSKYYLVAVIHLTICVCVGAISMASTGVMFMNCGIHACALFKVAK